MAVQTSYGYATPKGIPGGIYDLYHYPVDSRFNEEDNGKLRFGVGVVKGSIPGSNVVLPTSASTAADFEGVTVNGFNQQHDLEGKVSINKNQNIGVMRHGRIWVRLAASQPMAIPCISSFPATTQAASPPRAALRLPVALSAARATAALLWSCMASTPLLLPPKAERITPPTAANQGRRIRTYG